MIFLGILSVFKVLLIPTLAGEEGCGVGLGDLEKTSESYLGCKKQTITKGTLQYVLHVYSMWN